MGRVLGIDLGTTNTVAACLKIGGAEVLPNAEGDYITRSMVASHKNVITVGRVPFNRWPLAPQDTIVSVKRLMGRSFADSEVQEIIMEKRFFYRIVPAEGGSTESLRVAMESKLYSPIDISAFILKKIKDDAEMRLREEVTHAVITVPAYFNDRQRQATREAGMRAGLKVMRLLDEPAAAAIAYGINNPTNEPKNILVYDLGGGTFDVTIMAAMEGTFVELVKEGDMWLGGDDFDQILYNWVIEQGDPLLKDAIARDLRAAIEIKKACQAAKETLSSSPIADIIIPACTRDSSGNPIDVIVEINRKQFEEMTAHLVQRTVDLVLKAIENAHLSVNDIDWVVMAGSASVMPHILNRMEQLFGKEKIKTGMHPKHCVAIGAAIAAAQMNSIMCPRCETFNPLAEDKCQKCGEIFTAPRKKVCPKCGKENNLDDSQCSQCQAYLLEMDSIGGGITGFYYGITTDGDRHHIYVNKGDAYETPQEKRITMVFKTQFPNQPYIAIPVWRSEDPSSGIYEKMGEAIALMPLAARPGTRVKVTLWLNADGYFEVKATLEQGGELPVSMLRWATTGSNVMSLLEECAILASEYSDHMSENQKAEVYKKQIRVMRELESDRIDNARNMAEELYSIVEGKKETVADASTIKWTISLANYIAVNYAWLIGLEVAYDLKKMALTLEKSMETNNQVQTNMLHLELKNALDELMFIEKNVPSFLGWCLTSRVIINNRIFPKDSEMAFHLERELDAVEDAARRGAQNALNKLDDFIAHLFEVYPKYSDHSGNAWVCPDCEGVNPAGSRYCKVCGRDLWLLAGF